MGIGSASEFLELVENAFAEFGWDSLGFLAVTGKSELMMRDILAVELHRSLGNDTHVAREWSSARHDLVVLESGLPSAIVETKFWTALNALDSKKIVSRDAKHGLLGALETDVKKIKRTRSDLGTSGHDFATTFFYAADPREMGPPPRGVIKYESHLARGIKDRKLEELIDDAVVAFAHVGSSFGSVASGRIGAGSCWGSQVVLGAVIVELT